MACIEANKKNIDQLRHQQQKLLAAVDSSGNLPSTAPPETAEEKAESAADG